MTKYPSCNPGHRKMGLVLVLFMALNIACSHKKILKPYSKDKPAKLAIDVLLTHADQKIAADSIGSRLIRRLALFSEERKDFILVQKDAEPDFVFNLNITDFYLVPDSTQQQNQERRDSIKAKYDRLNDSLQAWYEPLSTGELAAANIAVNVAANALLMPLGFMSVTVISDPGPKTVGPSYRDSKSILSTYTTARLAFEANLKNSTGNVIWTSGKKYNTFEMEYLIKEKEQLDVLVRDALLEIDGKIPFTSID